MRFEFIDSGARVTVDVDTETVLDMALWRRLVKERAGYACERCGAGAEGGDPARMLCAHHKNRDRRDNRLANGEYICRKCHSSEHAHEISAGMTNYRDARRYVRSLGYVWNDLRSSKQEEVKRFVDEHPEVLATT